MAKAMVPMMWMMSVVVMGVALRFQGADYSGLLVVLPLASCFAVLWLFFIMMKRLW